MSEKQIKDLERSIKKFNLVEIPVIDIDNTVLAGHQRLKVLHLLGRGDEEIDVRIPNRELTKKERARYLITSNAVHGEWDMDLLKEFDLPLLQDVGLDDIDLTQLFDEDKEIQEDDFDVDKELKKIKKPKTKPGDLVQLGNHRIICGDATDPKVLSHLVGRKKVDMIYSDPPYNIQLDYGKGIGGKKNYGGNVDDNLSDTAYRKFLKDTLNASLAVTKPNAHIFYWCDQTYVGLIQELYRELGITNRRVCLWLKNSQNPTPAVAFNKCYEPVVYGTRGRPYLAPAVTNLNEVLNKDIGTGNNLVDGFFDLQDVWAIKRLPGKQYEHPTAKPHMLHEKAIRRCTRPNDLILDSFGGSGSTLIAAEQLGRTAYLVEREPVFVDLIIRRWEKLTGKKVRVTRHEKE
jgi:DNA modification methylase